jgi:hypothetical protein
MLSMVGIDRPREVANMILAAANKPTRVTPA